MTETRTVSPWPAEPGSEPLLRVRESQGRFTMTKHNATWSEQHYHSDSDIQEEIEDDDPVSDDHGKSGYWDYRDDT